MSENLTTLLKSKVKTVKINRSLPTVVIGERINPTGRKAVLEALQVGNFDIVRKDALDQVAAGAAVLDINAGVKRCITNTGPRFRLNNGALRANFRMR